MNRMQFKTPLAFFAAASLVFYVLASLISMAPMNLSFLCVLVIWGCTLVRSKQKRTSSLPLSSEFRSYRFWALALLITCWGSLLITKFFPYAYAGHDPEVTIHGFLKIWYLVIPAILLMVFETVSKTSTFSFLSLVKPWWWLTLAFFFVALIQYFTGWPLPQAIPDSVHRFHATLFFGHHLSTASIFIFPTFTALAVALGSITRKKKYGFITPHTLSPQWALLVGIAGFLVLFLSYARTAWIAILIGAFLLIKKYLTHVTRKQWVLAALLITLTGGALAQIPVIHARVQKLYGINDRVELWKANIDFFTHRPITGIGWLKTQEMSEFYFKQIDPDHYQEHFWGHAHSNFFEMLGGTGLIGLFAFLGWSLFTLRFAHRLATRFELRALTEKSSASQGLDFFYSDFARGIFIALILLHFNGLTNVTFWEGKVMHQQMLAVAMLLILDRIFNSSVN